MKARFQDGSVIVEISEHPQDDHVLLSVSKQHWGEDVVQVKLSRSVAGAIGQIMKGMGHEC